MTIRTPQFETRGRTDRSAVHSTRWFLRALCVCASVLCLPALAAETLPDDAAEFLTSHCADCHTGETAEGNVRFNLQPISWQASATTDFWERVYNAISKKEMPPSDADQPTAAERRQILGWLERQLTIHAKPGGTVIRRLNREEYENTIRDLFDYREFKVPDAFPSDDSEHGFDNIGQGLILSPPLMAQYLELATQVADYILPPDTGPRIAASQHYEIGATGLAESSLTSIEGDRFRIVSSKENAHTAGWPSRFAARQSGVYRLKISATTLQTDRMHHPRQQTPFQMSIYAKPKTKQTYDPFDKIRKLAQFDVDPGKADPQSFTCEIELNKGEAFGIRWANGPFQSRDSLIERLRQDRRLHAAMLALGKDPRGMSQGQYYQEVSSLLKGELDVDDPRLDDPFRQLGFGGIGQKDGPQLMVQWFVHEEFRRFGPALDITDVSIEGPLRLIEDAEMRTRRRRTAQFLGRREVGATDREFAEQVLRRFLPRAYRHPAADDQVQDYVNLVMQNRGPGGRVEDGLHVAVRRALISPQFVYRSAREGKLDDFDLASRLSYFLTSAPPDDTLRQLAEQGELSSPDVLKRETLRLLASPHSKNFVHSFTGQWLGTRLLHDIMPDPRLFFYYEAHRQAMTDEVEMLFDEILRQNHPVDTFIDPGFSYRNKHLNKIYGDNLTSPKMQRVSLERGGRQGGVLGLAAIMMATANGVDTHPVQRGVWLLDNVFGTPTPEPPNNVPAISPDTTGTTTMRSLVEAHRADASCASCHDKIDPLGMVLENFDPVGRWRDHYPIFIQPKDGEEALKAQFYANTGKGTKAGPQVDSVGVLPDGTRLDDVTDLKRYLKSNIHIFARCVARKLLVYATGRPMNFGDERVIDQLVHDVQQQGNGFRDLIVAIVQSESFGAK